MTDGRRQSDGLASNTGSTRSYVALPEARLWPGAPASSLYSSASELRLRNTTVKGKGATREKNDPDQPYKSASLSLKNIKG